MGIEPTEPSYRHSVPVRYGEVDMQGVVFNAHYMAYCDDACDRWMRVAHPRFEDLGWEPMVVKAVLEWQGAATLNDTIDIGVHVSRWGNTSFDISFVGAVGERPVFSAIVTYVGVKLGTREPIPPPDAIRAALS